MKTPTAGRPDNANLQDGPTASHWSIRELMVLIEKRPEIKIQIKAILVRPDLTNEQCIESVGEVLRAAADHVA
jgi:hypothetical protein